MISSSGTSVTFEIRLRDRYGVLFKRDFTMSILPRKGDRVFINEGWYEVTDVAWNMDDKHVTVECER